MGDKNNKSFSDLFSSISSDDDSSQDKKITFDNLLDNVQTEKESSLSSSDIFSSVGNVGEEKVIEEKKNISKENMNDDKEKGAVDSFRFGDIFHSEAESDFVENQSNDLNDEMNDETEKLNSIDDRESDAVIADKMFSFNDIRDNPKDNSIDNSSLDNPFFDQDSSLNDKMSVGDSDFLEKKQFADQKTSFDNKQEDNPFFSNKDSLDEEKLVEENDLEKRESPELDDSLKKEENSNNESILKEKEVSNPFFEEVGQSEEKKNSVIDFSSSDDNSSSGVDLGNVFFQNDDEKDAEDTSLDLKNTDEEQSDFLRENLPNKSEEQVEKKPEVISPFFADNHELEENYSSLGKINLIENDKQNKLAKKIDLSTVKHYDVKIEKKKESLLKFVLGVISYAIFIWLLLVGVALLVYVLDIKIRAAKGDYSSPTFNAYVVLTGSMLPEIQVYDVVVTKKVDPSNLKVGDVITFASADTRFLNTIITHRIIKKEYDNKTKSYSFQTQGDNNNVADSALVPQNNIFGKVILKIPKLGYLQEFLASDGGWIIVILIPCLTVVSYDVVKLIKGLKKKKYKSITVQK